MEPATMSTNPFSWFARVSDADIRAEIWGLGARHLGAPLDGALCELKDPGLSSERATLLRACVRKLRQG